MATREISPGNTTYFVHPVAGRDGQRGTARDEAWQTFAPVNRLELAITGNRFVECGEGAIRIDPRTRTPEVPVHRNIRITGNTFVLAEGPTVVAKACAELVVEGNRTEMASAHT